MQALPEVRRPRMKGPPRTGRVNHAEPKPPTVIFLDTLRKAKTRICKERNFVLQPSRKVLTETTGIDKVRLHLTMIEQVGFNRGLTSISVEEPRRTP